MPKSNWMGSKVRWVSAGWISLIAAQFNCYFNRYFNCSLCVSQLIKYILNHPRGIPPDYMHFIGYSIGAHIAGLVANNLSPKEGKIGRITGYDSKNSS